MLWFAKNVRHHPDAGRLHASAETALRASAAATATTAAAAAATDAAESGYLLFYLLALARRAFYLCVSFENKLGKLLFALFALVFVDRHPPPRITGTCSVRLRKHLSAEHR